ncbi:hypothetical protein SAMN04490182_2066 [Pseudomonas cedrina]|uniref:Lipoprotein n=1 Tax=Pseudomonas cedrina TaxID=651740 RepID=A0ABY0UGR9_PSECE|nr:hypothetical protein [Pseudomonas cedrina]SDS65878.1 hypothetical protein SAMN04490182_2066 [Pseudomonas cedrina]
MKKVFGILALFFACVTLSACGNEKQVENCSGKGEAFFTESLNAYFSKHPRTGDDQSYTLQPGARYDETNDWWIVPFDYGDERAQALLSCDGHLEISSR